MENALARFPEVINQSLFFDSDFLLRVRLISWLISEGSSPKIFNVNFLQENMRPFANQAGGIRDRTSFTWLILVTLLIEGYAIFAGMHDLTDTQLTDSLTMIAALRAKLPELERELGWTQ